MNAVWLRLVYIVEFLVAIPAVYTLWSQVGGQGHLDLMPWYWKLLLGGGASWAIVRLTAAIIERESPWTFRSMSWMIAVLAFALSMAAVTYYYHLHEAPEEPGQEDGTTAALL
jgi:hypothetical protein